MPEQLDKRIPNRLDPCPAEERVCEWYDVPDLYAPTTHGAKEGESVDDGGVVYQRCGGGRRVLKKKIGGS